MAGNVLASSDSPEAASLAAWKGKVDILFASSFLHVFDWDQMMLAVKTLVSLSRPQAGSMITGKQMGSLLAGQYKMPTAHGFNYRHNEEIMKRFWEQVGTETNTAWQVDTELYEGLFELAENKGHA